MKITIFETEHFEGAFPVIKLFDKPGNEITVITSEETHKRFIDLFGNNASRYRWSVLPAAGKLRFFFLLYKKLKKDRPDLLYINTISNNHLLYALVLSALSLNRVVMTVHDINCLFESRFRWNFRQAIIHRGKKWLIKKVHEFNVVSDTMLPYLQTKTNNKPAHNVPGAVFENNYHPQDTGSTLRIVVPGSLDKRRRDYEQVFELAALADKERLELQIILLGGYFDRYGKGIITRSHALISAFSEIFCYKTKVVGQDEFDKQMNDAHFVFIPSVVHTHICGDIPETYGITKSSGNMFDVIKHAKPFIVPEKLTISRQLESSCYKYHHIGDIVAFLKKIVSDPSEYPHWQQEALKNSNNYTIEKIREKNPALFNDQNS
ncbi:MAG: glycosyltransferase [Chitinophagaceae bacterium]|nr:glycosyltransferase [Chitinophagaceae bacterium]